MQGEPGSWMKSQGAEEASTVIFLRVTSQLDKTYLTRMCGRYDNLIPRDAYCALFRAARVPRSNFPPRYNVAPTIKSRLSALIRETASASSRW